MRSPPRTVVAVTALLFSAATPRAQLADLQPGRNFTSLAQFGAERSQDIDAGDCDNDGDLDVLVVNGGEGAAQRSRLFINLGGLQGGRAGTFADETTMRFPDFPAGHGCDGDFVDIDDDGDLDIFVANSGSPASGGEASRFYVNRGGIQGGTLGSYTDETATCWGTLASVPASDQVLGGNAGPFRDYSCDGEFADLDDDGDADLFHGSCGPNLDGTRESRVFLNDGTGVFNEAWPWADPEADVRTHTVDLDLVDLDGDFDIDVSLSSRSSQARLYLNNLYGGLSGARFQDVTQAALVATGAIGSATSNYAGEYGDVDGDGDFDLWMVNYEGDLDRVLRNDGVTPGTGFTFTLPEGWIRGDPAVDENELAFLDFDGDGDLDAFSANFSGTNWLYQSSLAQGPEPAESGLFHRTGLAGSLAQQPELPGVNNGGQTLDAAVADVDGDGDDDLLVANDADQQNYLFLNTLGVPDTHAPTFHAVTRQGDKLNGSGTVIHAQIRDNASPGTCNGYPAVLHWSANGGAGNAVRMFAQGSQQFRAVIPALANATVAYHVTVTDLAGNTATSESFRFVQGSACEPWTDIGFGLGGAGGIPVLAGSGPLLPGSTGALSLSGARPSASALLFVALGSAPVPFKGGTLAAAPAVLTFGLPTGEAGGLTLPWARWPAGLPSGTELCFQWAIADAAGPMGAALSNALRALTP